MLVYFAFSVNSFDCSYAKRSVIGQQKLAGLMGFRIINIPASAENNEFTGSISGVY